MRLVSEAVLAGDDDVDDQPVELGMRAGGVDRVETLVELLHGQPAFAGGVAEDLRVALAVRVGRAQLGERVVGHSPQRTFRAMMWIGAV